eukprot:2748047-Rhodomonas_salina.3
MVLGRTSYHMYCGKLIQSWGGESTAAINGGSAANNGGTATMAGCVTTMAAGAAGRSSTRRRGWRLWYGSGRSVRGVAVTCQNGSGRPVLAVTR